MRVLLDEQLPRQLAPHVAGHDVRTVHQEGWAGLRNGELLKRAVANGFEAFITADQNLQFQQNLRQSGLFVVVLIARSNALEDLLSLVPERWMFSRRPRPDVSSESVLISEAIGCSASSIAAASTT